MTAVSGMKVCNECRQSRGAQHRKTCSRNVPAPERAAARDERLKKESWDARQQPAWGNAAQHMPHNGFATDRTEPWCYGVSEDGGDIWGREVLRVHFDGEGPVFNRQAAAVYEAAKDFFTDPLEATRAVHEVMRPNTNIGITQ